MKKPFNYDDFYTLTGKARNFRVSGKKLLPRDSTVFYYGKTNKERKRAAAVEREFTRLQDAEHLASVNAPPSSTEAQVVRTRMALSTRRALYVENMFHAMVEDDTPKVVYEAAMLGLGHAQWRYFRALDYDWSVRMAEEADARMGG